MSEWIKCSERMPEWPAHNSFLAYSKNFGIFIQHGHMKMKSVLVNSQCAEITHWMPLPEPPKDKP